MDIQSLRIFKSVAEYGSISKAAKELNYAQSNITTRMQQLENSLQTVLFYRHNKGVTLTAKGELLITYADKIFRLLDETTEVMRDQEEPQGSLSIGSMETTAAVHLPRFLSRYHSVYPQVDLNLKTGPTSQHIEAVLNYKLDGAFVSGPLSHPDLITKKVFSEELVLVGNSLLSQSLKSRKVDDLTLLVLHKGCFYREKLKHWLHEEGVIPSKVMEFGSLDALMGCIAAGLGVTLLPLSIVQRYSYLENVTHYPIPEKFSLVDTLFIYRTDVTFSTPLIKFVEMFQEESVSPL
ncbi:LysR family transcriptional regulator [Priestia sp. 179-F W1.4 NHS]|uniref:LysR family transcriptional regulator n=1 Tax=Priestia sp. 179-F W1.4 NHS TaxID=3374296 RepID=UPI0038792F64